jgi:hypothetical protein
MFTKKRVGLLSLALLTLLICNSANAHHKDCSMEDVFFKDITAFQKQHPGADIDITPVAEKYIHIGDSIDKTKTFLIESAFNISEHTSDKTNEKYIFAQRTKHPRGLFGGITGSRYVVYVHHENNKVTRILAQKFYHGL